MLKMLYYHSDHYKVWDFSSDNRQALFTLSGHKGWVNGLAFGPDGRYLVTASRDGTARLWDISPAGNEELLTLAGHSDFLTSIAFSPDGTLLATSGNDTTAKIWDISSGQTLFTLTNHEAPVNVVKFSPDGTLLATGSEDNTARLWDANTGQELRILSGHAERGYDFHFDGIMGLSFSPDGERLATTGVDGQVKIWDVETGKESLTLSGHPENKAILSVVFSPDGQLLAAGTDKPSTIKVWDSETGKERMTLPGYELNRIFNLAFSPDGNLLAVGNNAGRLDVWQLPQEMGATGGQTAEILFSIPSANATRSLSFNTSGTQIITSGKIWDAITGQLLLTFINPAGVGDADFSPDGTRVAAAGLDGLVRLFTLDLDELATLAQSRVTRSLAMAECQQYLHLDKCPEGE
jgi:WD40 repeat protein